jgi:hypothetical protein
VLNKDTPEWDGRPEALQKALGLDDIQEILKEKKAKQNPKRGNVAVVQGCAGSNSEDFPDEETGIKRPRLMQGTDAWKFVVLSKIFKHIMGPHFRDDADRNQHFAGQLCPDQWKTDSNHIEGLILARTDANNIVKPHIDMLNDGESPVGDYTVSNQSERSAP